MTSLNRLTLAALAGLSVAVLSACDSSDADYAAPSAVSEGEEAALDEAAKMLDAQRLPQGALPDVDPPAAEAGDQTQTR